MEVYHGLALHPVVDILEYNQPTTEPIDALISSMAQDRAALGIPQGCLFAMMLAHSEHLGRSPRDNMNQVHRDLLATYSEWIERAKLHGEFINIPTDIAALLLDMQHGGAMRMQREGVPRETIESVLRYALGAVMFRDNAISP